MNFLLYGMIRSCSISFWMSAYSIFFIVVSIARYEISLPMIYTSISCLLSIFWKSLRSSLNTSKFSFWWTGQNSKGNCEPSW